MSIETKIYVAIIGGHIILAMLIGWIPGSIARNRQHPSADAIAVCGWIGALLAWVFWLVAFIWAYTAPPPRYHRVRNPWDDFA